MIHASVLLIGLGLSGPVAASDVSRLAQAQLPRTLGADSLRWSLAYPWAPMQLPAGATDIQLVLPGGEPRPGVMSAELEVLHDGQVLRSAAVPLRCERLGPAVRLARGLPAGAVLETGDLEEVRGVLPAGDRPLDAGGLAVGRRLRRALPARAWLTAACVERVPLVRHGQGLEVSAETATLRVRFQAVAQQEGALGEIIRARGARNGALLRVRITGGGLAELVP